MEHDGIGIVVIRGSVRPNNYTTMAAALVVDELQREPRVRVEVIDPAALSLPLPGTNPDASGTKVLQQKVAAATGVVLATPEYHGSFSSVMKLVIENLGFPSVLAGKPVALLGVAAGAIGAIKSLEQLRGVVSHIGALPLPLAVSVANVQKVFAADGRCLDPAMEKLVRSVGLNLLDYIRQNLCPRITLERILREGPSALAAAG
ncbi:MAG TPA: NAD(P)H-dependent oxidoreductase [Terriglobales bacterium]|nr:NAD(P)H-dependent oxidoreductase [Terriglobales bacterium]